MASPVLNSAIHRQQHGVLPVAAVGAGLLVAAALSAVVWVAPRESTMGDVQRMVYLHVAVAWCGLAGCLAMGVSGAGYLLSRRLVWDHAAQAAGEIGWICTSLTLLTGSLWAREAWGTWWTWEPRLTAALILWFLYAGYFLTRGGVESPQRRARLSAVLAILGTADVPLIVMATRWFRGMHPVAPTMDPPMRLVLFGMVIAWTALTLLLFVFRCRQLAVARQIDAWWEAREEAV